MLNLITTTGFEKVIYTEIVNLYSNLEKSLIPKQIFINADRTQLLYPISIGVPSQHILSIISNKVKAFGQMIPGVKSTYKYDHPSNESLYLKEMGESIFAWTYKKAG